MLVKQAVTAGYFYHTARLGRSGQYRTVKHQQVGARVLCAFSLSEWHSNGYFSQLGVRISFEYIRRYTVKPLLSRPLIKRTPFIKWAVSLVTKLAAYIYLYNKPLFGGHLYQADRDSKINFILLISIVKNLH